MVSGQAVGGAEDGMMQSNGLRTCTNRLDPLSYFRNRKYLASVTN
jgi:hypothetical protein